MLKYNEILNEQISISKFLKAIKENDGLAVKELFISLNDSLEKEYKERKEKLKTLENLFTYNNSESQICGILGINIPKSQKLTAITLESKLNTISKRSKIFAMDNGQKVEYKATQTYKDCEKKAK